MEEHPGAVRKVLIYLTQGRRLLVFSHPFHPDAGLQVPGGTIEAGEDLREAATRELAEETGLAGFELGDLLGQADYSWRFANAARIDRRYFFHATIVGSVPETWRHYERYASDGTGPIAFDFFWWDLLGPPPQLTHGQGDLLSRLLSRIGR